jgi:hypothetical protein
MVPIDFLEETASLKLVLSVSDDEKEMDIGIFIISVKEIIDT